MVSGSMTGRAARGCGASRVQGGVYFECGLGEDGLRVERFLKDRPISISASNLSLSDRGVKFIQDKKGVWHILDIVGRESYPDVARFVEEVRRLGLSRRAANTSPFGLLSPESKILCAHRRAIIENPGDTGHYGAFRTPRPLWRDRPDGYHWEYCPKLVEASSALVWRNLFGDIGSPTADEVHDKNGCAYNKGKGAFWWDSVGMCAGLWWEDIAPASDVFRDQVCAGDDRAVCVQMPSFEFYAKLRPTCDNKAKYSLGIFAAFPITNLVVVKGEGEQESIKRLADQGMIVLENGDAEGAESTYEHGSIPVFRVDA